MKCISTFASNPLHGIQNLAPELLSGIFLLCLPDPELWSMRSASQAPLLLGRVCSRWRTISHSTATLWSHFNIGDFTYEMQKPNYIKDAQALHVWIERSLSCLLSITVIHDRSQSQNESNSVSDESFEKLLLTVVSQSSRWIQVNAMIPSEFGEILVAALCSKNIVKLERFKLCIWDSSPADNPGMTRHRFTLSTAPRLTHLELSADFIQIDFHGPPHPIRVLKLRRGYNVATHLGDLLTCLTQCPNLMSLFYRLRHSLYIPVYPTLLELKHLRWLWLEIHPRVDPSFLFDHILLPELTDLGLEMTEHSEPDWPHLLTMLKRCNPPLTSLTLNDIPMEEHTLLECLLHTPKLRILDTYGFNHTDLTLKAFTIDDDSADTSSILCPRLQQLELKLACGFSKAAIKRMILSRWSGQHLESHLPTPPGREITRIWYTCSTNDILLDPAIAKCVEEGLWLYVAGCPFHERCHDQEMD